MLGVILVDLGLALGFFGFVGMVRPVRRLGLPTRRRALFVFAVGLACGLAGALLPAGPLASLLPLAPLGALLAPRPVTP